jgi:hypothetical protein
MAYHLDLMEAIHSRYIATKQLLDRPMMAYKKEEKEKRFLELHSLYANALECVCFHTSCQQEVPQKMFTTYLKKCEEVATKLTSGNEPERKHLLPVIREFVSAWMGIVPSHMTQWMGILKRQLYGPLFKNPSSASL